MHRQIPHAETDTQHSRSAVATTDPDAGRARSATAVGLPTASERRARRRNLTFGLIGALAVTVVSAVFVASFIGGLHDPGPRSVPIGVVGPSAVASRLSSTLSHQEPGAFTVSRYTSVSAVRSAIGDRNIDAAVVPSRTRLNLLVASAVSEAETNAIVKTFSAGAAKAHIPLAVSNIRPLHPGDPEGLSQVFFVTALLAPSLVFGSLLINRIGTKLSELWHLAMIVIYAVIISAVATAIADAAIGALTGAPWAIFGIGALLAFAAAVISAAVTGWLGSIGYVVLMLLFVPVGLASSGTTLGPRMITPWYADLGKALPPGTALPAIRNVTYFNGNQIIVPLLVLSAWALAGIIGLVLAAILHPPVRGQREQGSPQQVEMAQPAHVR